MFILGGARPLVATLYVFVKVQIFQQTSRTAHQQDELIALNTKHEMHYLLEPPSRLALSLPWQVCGHMAADFAECMTITNVSISIRFKKYRNYQQNMG